MLNGSHGFLIELSAASADAGMSRRVIRVALTNALNWVWCAARSGTHHFEKIRVLKAGEVFSKRCLSLEQVSME